MSYAERKRDVLSPSSGDGVDVGSADTTGINGNVDIVLLKLLEGKLIALSVLLAQQGTILLTSLRVKVDQFLMSVMANASVVSG